MFDSCMMNDKMHNTYFTELCVKQLNYINNLEQLKYIYTCISYDINIICQPCTM